MKLIRSGVPVPSDPIERLIFRARKNEAALRQFQALETMLLSINSLPGLIEHAVRDTREIFMLEKVALALVTEQERLGRFLRDSGPAVQEIDGLVLLDGPERLGQVFGKHARPYLGPYERERCAGLFAEPPSAHASVALLPLFRQGRFLGCLSLASRDGMRFSGIMATDFLDHLARILAVCLENALSFELLRQASLVDPVTGVNNRHCFDQRLAEEIARAARTGSLLSCLFLDIDHFKAINDTYGHPSGDRVLAGVAREIRAMLRVNDLFARYGGEEFVALLAVTDPRESLLIAERIRRGIAAYEWHSVDGETMYVTLSIGVATLRPKRADGNPCSGEAPLINLADHALYQAKGNGRNRVVDGGFVYDG